MPEAVTRMNSTDLTFSCGHEVMEHWPSCSVNDFLGEKVEVTEREAG